MLDCEQAKGKQMRQNLYIFAYDIADNRRRRRIANLLESHGLRKNLSVFECFLPQKQYLILLDKIYELISLTEDSVLIYPLSSNDAAKKISLGKNLEDFSGSIEI